MCILYIYNGYTYTDLRCVVLKAIIAFMHEIGFSPPNCLKYVTRFCVSVV